MKILSLTAGAAQMYCGSCLRDNALAAELIALGHDVILLPLYTPTLTDEQNVSRDKIFYGGISIYLEQHMRLFRKLPRFLDRLWDSNFALKLATKKSIPTSPAMLGELTVSVLKGERGFHAKELSKLIDWLRREPPPDIISLPYALMLGLARPLKEALKRAICCTLQGEDLFIDGLQEPYRTQTLELIRENVPYVDAFLPVSDWYRSRMSGYLGIPLSKMHVAPIGINTKGYETEFRFHTNCFTVGYFARVAPEKGLHLLCEAYRRLRQRTEFSGATLEVAGYLAPEHKPYLQGIERQMKEWGFSAEFQYRGVLNRQLKIEFLRNLDVLSVPSTYDEPKGIYILEALATGVPVVVPRRGSLTEVVEKTQGGILSEPDDPDSLAQGILTMWKNRELASAMGRQGAAAVREHYSARRMAERTVEVFTSLAGKSESVAAGRT
ncbi:MAG: glycosyltransferase family 4 protein [Bryobacteraceae bacterium]